MSSLGGSSSSGNRSRIAATVSSVSSTDSVVCESQATFDGVADHDAGARRRALHELDVLGRLAGGALDLLVAVVADQQDVVVVVGEPLRLVVHLGHQRAGRVDGLQPALGGLDVHRRRDAVGGEDHGRALGHLVELLDEDRAARLEVGDDVLVVHDLLAHVDRRAVEVERLLDGDDRAVDAGAVAARRREQDGAVGDARKPRSVVVTMVGSHATVQSTARPVRRARLGSPTWRWRPHRSHRRRSARSPTRSPAGSTGSARSGSRARSPRSTAGPASAPSS